MNPLRYRRPTLAAIQVTTEALAWFVLISVLVTMTQQSFLETLADRLEGAVNARQVADVARAEVMLGDLRDALDRTSGPSWFIVLAAAFGGYLLMRLTQRLDMGPAVGSLLLIAGTLLGVNLLLHASLGNAQVWDASYVTELLSQQGTRGSEVELDQFVASGSASAPHGNALVVILVGLLLTWFRFLIVARSATRMERMAHSFTVSFLVILVTLILARTAGVQAPSWVAVPQFALGMLGLAVANHERAVPAAEAEERASPWMTSVAGTLALLVVSAGVIGMLAYLQVGALLSAVGDVLLVALQVVLIVVLTPILWVMEGVFNLIFDGRNLEVDLFQMPNAINPPDVPDGPDTSGEPLLPAWMRDSLKFLALVGAGYVVYVVGRFLTRRDGQEEEAVEEHRITASGGAGIGRLLTDLLSFRRRSPDRWSERHPVYQLFARAVGYSEERGLRRLPSETPGEFGQAAVGYLSAAPVAASADLFERARYGRHFPDAESVREASAALTAWHEANPPTEEMRERVRGLRPQDEGQEIAMRIALAKKGISLEDESSIRGD